MQLHQDTIVAISTPPGSGAIGVVRVSGSEAISIVDGIFSKSVKEAEGYSLHYGNILYEEGILDEVIISVFRGPRSYTKEDVIEISCHGSPYILDQLMQLLISQGARPALAGEFTQRAYLNGAMDLAQAEAVADLIASSSAGAHQLAINQMRGGISKELKDLREELLNFTSLIELELDFGEEDVEFADRNALSELVARIANKLDGLIQSFKLGNAIKQGVPTVILGKPNAGKSTLLNALLNDERAIVSNIPGTTRDMIEDRVIIEGIEFRLMDTAGMRETEDVIEAEGVNRSLKAAKEASLVLYVFDQLEESKEEALTYLQRLNLSEHASCMLLANKEDLLTGSGVEEEVSDGQHLESMQSLGGNSIPLLSIAAKEARGLGKLKEQMVAAVASFSEVAPDQAIISNARHLACLDKSTSGLVRSGSGPCGRNYR